MEKRVKNAETIGTRILKSRPGSQTELAEQLTKMTGKVYTRGAVANWETDRRTINSDDLIALSKALGCSADYLLGLDVQNTGLSPEALKKLSEWYKGDKVHDYGCIRFFDALIRSSHAEKIGTFFAVFEKWILDSEEDQANARRYHIAREFDQALDEIVKNIQATPPEGYSEWLLDRNPDVPVVYDDLNDITFNRWD